MHRVILNTVNMYVFIILLVAPFAYAIENSSVINALEGMGVLASFRYKSDFPAPFILGIGNRSPFYIEGQFAQDYLSTSQLHRFEVNAWHSETRGYSMIHLTISNVNRSDGGTYYCRYGKLQRTQVIALNVHFPPGKVQCLVSTTNESMWEMLKCSATGGNPRGRIGCLNYQRVEIPILREPGENETHIIQTLFVKKNTSVYCCGINEATPLSHECHDFVLQRDNFYEIQSTSKPKQTKTSSNVSITPFKNVSSTKSAKTTTSTKAILIYISVAALVIAFIVLVIITFICVYYKRHNESVAKRKSIQSKTKDTYKYSKTETSQRKHREPPSIDFEREIDMV